MIVGILHVIRVVYIFYRMHKSDFHAKLVRILHMEKLIYKSSEYSCVSSDCIVNLLQLVPPKASKCYIAWKCCCLFTNVNLN